MLDHHSRPQDRNPNDRNRHSDDREARHSDDRETRHSDDRREEESTSEQGIPHCSARFLVAALLGMTWRGSSPVAALLGMMRGASPLRCLKSALILMAALLIAAGCTISGCAKPRLAPAPHQVVTHSDTKTLSFDMQGGGHTDYQQRLKNGYKDRLFFPAADGTLTSAVERPLPDPQSAPLLVLMLDGVAYDRIATLWDAGHFRLFFRPTRVVSIFPTLTDPAYDVFLGTGPTPGYEAEYFDRNRNTLVGGAGAYLAGANEKWVHYSDYRLKTSDDPIMYLRPDGTFDHELARGRAVLDERFNAGDRAVVLYFLSTDGLGHTKPIADLDRHFADLDAWLERIVYDYRGRLEIVALADHGMSAFESPAKRFDVRKLLTAQGLHSVKRLSRSGEFAMPEFGLLDLARFNVTDEATRDRIIDLLAPRPEVELLAWRAGERIGVRGAAGTAYIFTRTTNGRLEYKYEPATGDPLGVEAVRGALRTSGMGADGYAPVEAWFAATSEFDFPNAVPRLSDGMERLSTERPDAIVTLVPGWYIGDPLLSGFVDIYGTHGGLHRRVTDTYFMTTFLELPGPVRLDTLGPLVRERFGWQPSWHSRPAN
jgi:hypothetical protein